MATTTVETYLGQKTSVHLRRQVNATEGVSSFRAAHRLNTTYRRGGTYDLRVPKDEEGLTLYVCYGNRKSDWSEINGKWGNLNVRFVCH